MKDTMIVEVFRKTPHPMYKKIIKRSKKYKVDCIGFENITVGSAVKIIETRPISKDKYFKISEVIGSNTKKPKDKIIEKEDISDVKPIQKTAKIKSTKVKAVKKEKK